MILRLLLAAALGVALAIVACSSDSGGINSQTNAASDCEQHGAKCYANAGGCPGSTVLQQWTCPQEPGGLTSNKCCAVPDAGKD
jgi:hypothetical protein